MARPATTGNFKTREQLEKKVVAIMKKGTYAKAAKECGIGIKTAWLIAKHQERIGK